MNRRSQKYLESRYTSGEISKNRIRKVIIKLREKRFARKFASSSKKILQSGIQGVGQEAIETKEMANSFYRLLESKLDLTNRKEPPTKEEVKAAIEQLKDVGRFSVFATISILPGGGISLIGLEILARKLGVKNFTFVPSAFKKGNKTDIE